MHDRVLRDALSIGVATGVYAVSFGVLSVAAGFSVAQTCVMSLVAFTGASQFTFVSVMGAGGGVAAALAPAALLAARNGIYALSLGPVLGGGDGGARSTLTSSSTSRPRWRTRSATRPTGAGASC